MKRLNRNLWKVLLILAFCSLSAGISVAQPSSQLFKNMFPPDMQRETLLARFAFAVPEGQSHNAFDERLCKSLGWKGRERLVVEYEAITMCFTHTNSDKSFVSDIEFENVDEIEASPAGLKHVNTRTNGVPIFYVRLPVKRQAVPKAELQVLLSVWPPEPDKPARRLRKSFYFIYKSEKEGWTEDPSGRIFE